jgi:hypothetical protein
VIALLRYLPLIIWAVLFIAALVDIIRIEPQRVRAAPKVVWILISVVPIVGPILWFTQGRERLRHRTARASVAPDDDPEFLRRLASEKEQEQRIRDLEQQLSELDVDPDDDPPKSPKTP